jgi:hypothetical protein
MQNAVKTIKNNTRYFLAISLIALIFLISKNFFADNTVTSDDCKGGKCPGVADGINLSDSDPVYFSNDIFSSNSGEYYRVSFKDQSDKNTSITVKLTNAFDEEEEIKSFELKKASGEFFREILFPADGKYTDIKFEKKNPKDGANVKISSVQVTRLNVASTDEFSKLKPSISGEVDFGQEDQKQTSDSSAKFSQSAEKGILVGQVFKPQTDYITGVAFDMDISKSSGGSSRKYSIQLREADYDGESLEIGKLILAEESFSLSTANNYRQEDGKLKFPIFSRLEKGKYYFIGINNDKAIPDKFDNIVIRGSKDNSKYPDGIIGVKTKGSTYTVVGALCFATYGASFKKYNDREILSSSLIQDLGKGKGLFVYKNEGLSSDVIDLYSSSPDVTFDSGKSAISGTANQDSYIEYKFYTIYPFSKMRISGMQADEGWSKVDIAYSFDGDNWTEIPSDASGSLQSFDWEISNARLADAVYLKITPYYPEAGYPEASQKQYGIADFRAEAELIMK